MHIYYYTTKVEKKLYLTTKDLLNRNDAKLLSNLEPETIKNFVQQKELLPGELPLDYMDGFIVEEADIDEYMGYIIAFARTRKIPLLYIYDQLDTHDNPYRELVNFQQKRRNFFYTYRYSPDFYESVLTTFLAKIDSRHILSGHSSVKFTLRLPQRLHDALNTYCKRNRTNKAEMLRTLLNKFIVQQKES